MILHFDVSTQNISDLYDKSVQSVVTIFTLSNDYSQEKITTNSALGSGFIVSTDGLILTAAHVVEVADKLYVKFYDGSISEANIVATNASIDAAIIKLKISPPELKPIILATPESIRVGEKVYIIGAPMGIENSLSVGYISGKKSTGQVVNGKVIEQFQTDAAINTGNSGGPMLNMKGEVIGVVSHIISRSGGFEGIGYVTTARQAYDALVQTEVLWSGFDGRFLDETLAKILNVPQKSGFLVQRVVSGSMADKMGMKAGFVPFTYRGENILLGGDIILDISGQKCTAPHDLALIRNLIRSFAVGDILMMTLWRGGKEVLIQTH
jgi:S1-C subfamily serine protease